jgi:hypothetical protein
MHSVYQFRITQGHPGAPGGTLGGTKTVAIAKLSKKRAVKTKAKSKTDAKGKGRIGHVYANAHGAHAEEWDAVPRGWITPEGKFLSTREHWSMIATRFGIKGGADPEIGERAAHRAYAGGWISIGHGGALNAIGHETVWDRELHPAIRTLRELVAKLPHDMLRVETQRGNLNPETGRHEDFDIRECELEFFIKRGKLRRM